MKIVGRGFIWFIFEKEFIDYINRFKIINRGWIVYLDKILFFLYKGVFMEGGLYVVRVLKVEVLSLRSVWVDR